MAETLVFHTKQARCGCEIIGQHLDTPLKDAKVIVRLCEEHAIGSRLIEIIERKIADK